MSTSLVTIENHFKPLVPRMAEVIPASANLPAQRIMQSVLIACERAPKLMECTALSMQEAVFSACALGLLVDGITGQGYLVAYGTKVQFQTGFKGYTTICARSGFTLGADNVFQGEKYKIRLGTHGIAEVEPDFSIRGPNAKLIASFAFMESNNFPSMVDAMSKDEIMAIRAITKTTRSDSPWNTHFNEMAKKTVKRRLGKSAPVDILQRAIALDDAADRGQHAYIRPEDQALIIDEQEAGPLTVMQPPPSEAFSIRDTAKFEVIFGDGVVRDLGSLANWERQIWERLQKVEGWKVLEDFADRNKATFAAIAERHPREVEGLRMKIRERVDGLKRRQDVPDAETASTGQPAPQNIQSSTKPAAAFELFDGPGVTRKFDDLAKYLTAYELTVSHLFSNGKASELLKFDQLNMQPIAQLGLADSIAKINARVRVAGGQQGLGV